MGCLLLMLRFNDLASSAALTKIGFFLTLGFILICGQTFAQTRFLPETSAVVLPSSVHTLMGSSGSLRALNKAWRAKPEDLQIALTYARAVFNLGSAEGDLRWYGSAKAALKPWWQKTDLPADGFFMRGLVKQGFHDFDGGLRDINQAIVLAPKNTEYWSWRFSLHLLQANMAAAKQDVDEIQRLFGILEANIYRAVLLYRTGQPLPSLKLLNDLIRSSDYQDAASQIWIGFHLGEAYRVNNQPDKTETLWQRLLQTHPQSHLLRLSLADHLNQQKEYKKAKVIASANSSDNTSNLTDALLMQVLIASRGLNGPDEASLASQMAARLQAQSLRQETLIERPRLIFQITYGNDPATGLTMSIENWKIQKEPADAVLFLQAALILNKAKSAKPVIDWIALTKYTDPRLSPLIELLLKHPSWSDKS